MISSTNPRWTERPEVQALTCIICKRPRAMLALFHPDDCAEAGLPPPPAGKERWFVYAVCDLHYRPNDDHMLRLIETAIRARCASGGN